MDDRTIEINRNIIERFLMKVKNILRHNFRVFIYSLISVFILLALLISVVVYINNREKKELEAFEKVIDSYYAQTEGREKNIQKTVDDLNKIIASSLWGYVKKTGNYVLGGLYLSANNYSEGKNYLLKFADKSASSFFAPFALLRAGLASEKLNDIDGALKIYERLEKEYKDSTIADEIYFDLGRVYQIKGNSVKAKEYYNKVIMEYPVSLFASEAKKRLILAGANN